MTFLRLAIRRTLPGISLHGQAARLAVSVRFYASKNKQTKSKNSKSSSPAEESHSKPKGPLNTSALVPGSQAIHSSPEYVSTQQKMSAAVDYFRKETSVLESRASGRVMPSLLDPVRVTLKDGERVKLDEVATVGVRDGSVLVVTVFEEGNLKHVETAIYDAKIPSVVPQKQDSRTIRIPIPKPTVEARHALYTTAHRLAEECRVQIRKHHSAALKKGKFDKHSKEIEEFQKLTDQQIAEVDKILTQMKKNLGVR
ncbi:ribosome recycling factor [Gloeophyllum trabeum ATCC 11539]|uniref:Ribosome recycling factor n=1 Tax=Gloeophyllum trabeum (strain ATCC 11539 / FP-39264 / Madison 617) TaxID=670483 RepID=S7RL81_GLOTA|nr:ribosome recycling factor [Gloeophyllum trabeum ATCC 11539]EPQ53424.1 ribosome recycling factor [Gloeophyllum trabeum ATCC 11539]